MPSAPITRQHIAQLQVRHSGRILWSINRLDYKTKILATRQRGTVCRKVVADDESIYEESSPSLGAVSQFPRTWQQRERVSCWVPGSDQRSAHDSAAGYGICQMGSHSPQYFDTRVSIFRDDLIDSVAQLGIHNLYCTVVYPKIIPGKMFDDTTIEIAYLRDRIKVWRYGRRYGFGFFDSPCLWLYVL